MKFDTTKLQKKIDDEYQTTIDRLKAKYGDKISYGQSKFRWTENRNPKQGDKVSTTSRRWAKGAFTE